MPRIYCPHCFPDAPRDTSSIINTSSGRMADIICNGVHRFDQQRVSSVRSTLNSPANTAFLSQSSRTHAFLQNWANQGNIRERASRHTLVTQMLDAGCQLNEHSTLEISGAFQIINSLVSQLPTPLNIAGNLSITACPELKEIPDFLQVRGKLNIQECLSLKSFSSLLTVNSISISNCPQLTDIMGPLCQLQGDLIIENCSQLQGLSAEMHIGGQFKAADCENLTDFPKHWTVYGDCLISRCNNLLELPENGEFYQHLIISECELFHKLPENIVLFGNLNVSYNPNLKHLPPAYLDLSLLNRFGNERSINIADCGFSDQFLQQLEASPFGQMFYTGISYNDGMYFSDHDAIKMLSIEVSPGDEYKNIIKQLCREPKAGIQIKYMNNRVVDDGGVSRQAFSKAFKQMLAKNPVFDQVSGVAHVVSFDIDDIKKGQTLKNNAIFAGYILGKMAQFNIGAGQTLDEPFYYSLHDVSQYLKRTDTGYDLQKLKHLLLSQETDSKDVLQVLQSLRPSTLKENMLDYYQQSHVREELRGFKGETLLYINLAESMQKTGFVFPGKYIDFYASLGGPIDLRHELSTKLQYTPVENVEIAGEEPAILINWMRQSIAESSDEEIQRLMQDLTGAHNLRFIKPFEVRLTVFDKSTVLFNSHTCALILDVNIDAFRDLIRINGYQIFKSDFLIGGSATFNGS